MILRFRRWLKDLPIQDPVDRQMAALLQVVLLGLASIIVLAGIVNMLLLAASLSTPAILLQSFPSLVVIGIPLFLLRRAASCGNAYLVYVSPDLPSASGDRIRLRK